MDRKKIGFIFPVYNEEGNIIVLQKELQKILETIKKKYDYEIIFVNDGSSDGSLEKLVQIHEKDKNIQIINLSRNFGHQIAITAGLDYTKADCTIIMDADLQDPPEVCLEMIKKWEEGYEVVFGQRRKRKDNIFKNITAFLFYRILDTLTEIQIPKDTGDFRLIDRKVVETIQKFREKKRFMRGLFAYVGFKQTAVFFDRSERYTGVTKYPLRKMMRLAIDGITSFSTVPLRLFVQIGFAVSFFSIIGIIYAITLRIFFPHITVSGFTLTIISIYFIGGIQMMMLGVLGTYIGQIFSEVQNRPLYIVSSVIS